MRALATGYARAVDRRDPGALADLFAGDATVTLAAELARGGLPRELRGPGAIARLIGGVRSFERTRHVVDGHAITVDGDGAVGAVTCTAHHVSGERDLVLTVHYDDVYAREDGRWRFRRRDLRLAGTRREPVRPVAMVTGATRGIGRAVAVAFARAGYDVVVTGRTVTEGSGRVRPRRAAAEDGELPVEGSLETTAAQIARAGTSAWPVVMDLTDAGSVTAAAEEALAAFGRIDVLVNNAIAHLPGSHASFADLDPARLGEVLAANFAAQVLLVQRVLPAMVGRGSGVIVNLVSASAAVDPPAPPDSGGWGLGYAAAKAAFGRIAGAVNAEYARHGIRAFNLDPGFVITEAGAVRGGTAAIAARGFRPGRAEDAAALAVRLATDRGTDRLLGSVVRAGALPGVPVSGAGAEPPGS